jgi:hypothetical protein
MAAITRHGGGHAFPVVGNCSGVLVAQEAGKTRDVRQLAHMSSDEVKPFVFATVHRLRENAR